MKNLEEREIKQFSEFEEVTPESSQNLITDKGRFTVGALFQAVSDNFKNVASKERSLSLLSSFRSYKTAKLCRTNTAI